LHYVTLHYITFIDAYMLYNDAKRCKDAKHVIHIFFPTIIEPHCQCSILCSTDSGPEIVEIMLTLAGHVALYQLLLLILICVSYFLTSYIFHPLNYYGITESLNKLPCLVTSVVKSVPKSSSLRLICLFSWHRARAWNPGANTTRRCRRSPRDSQHVETIKIGTRLWFQ